MLDKIEEEAIEEVTEVTEEHIPELENTKSPQQSNLNDTVDNQLKNIEPVIEAEQTGEIIEETIEQPEPIKNKDTEEIKKEITQVESTKVEQNSDKKLDGYESDSSTDESSSTSTSSSSSSGSYSRSSSLEDLKLDKQNGIEGKSENDASQTLKNDIEKATAVEIATELETTGTLETTKSHDNSEATNGNKTVSPESKKTSEEEVSGPHSGSGEDTLTFQVAEEMKKVLEDSNSNNREDLALDTMRSVDDASVTSSALTSSRSSISAAETEDKLTAMKTQLHKELAEITTESELSDNQFGGHDPDGVTNGKPARPLTSTLEPHTTHEGSIRSLIEGKTDIDLSSVTLTKTQIYELSETIKGENQLSTLVLRNGRVGDDDLHTLAMSLTANTAQLKMVNLNCNEIGPKGIHDIIHLLKQKPDIELLLLHGNPLGDAGVKELVSGLEEIHHERQTQASRRSSQHSVFSDKSEQAQGELGDTAKKIVSSAIESALQSRSLIGLPASGLIELDLGDVNMSDDGAAAVAKLIALNTNITTLSLTGNTNISLTGWRYIAKALSRNNKITTLSLDYCNLGSDAAALIMNGLKQNMSIKSLDLEGNKIKEDGGSSILEMPNMNKIISDITLMPGNSISNATLEEIKSVLLSRTAIL